MAYKMPNWFLTIPIIVLNTLDLTGIYILNFTIPTSQGKNGKWAGTSEDEKVAIYCDTHFVSRYDINFLCIAIYRYIDILWHPYLIYSRAMKTQHTNVHQYLKDILNILSQRILVILWILKIDTILTLIVLTWNVLIFIRMRTFQPYWNRHFQNQHLQA